MLEHDGVSHNLLPLDNLILSWTFPISLLSPTNLPGSRYKNRDKHATPVTGLILSVATLRSRLFARSTRPSALLYGYKRHEPALTPCSFQSSRKHPFGRLTFRHPLVLGLDPSGDMHVPTPPLTPPNSSPSSPETKSDSTTMSLPATVPPRPAGHTTTDGDDDISWSSAEISPTASEAPHHAHRPTFGPTPPTSPLSSDSGTHPIPREPAVSPTHPYRASNANPTPYPVPSTRLVRTRPFAPLTAVNPLPAPPHMSTGGLAKSQPLSRAMFARMSTDVPHAGSAGGGTKKKNGQQKLIVPTKGFRTTFELGLTASEFARRS